MSLFTSVLDKFASIFIDTFGITQPTEKTRRRASLFILGMLLLTLAIVVAFGAFAYQIMHHK